MLVFLIAGSANILCLAADKNQVAQLQAQMKTFSKRVRMYVRCVKGKCTQEEKQAAGKAALEDGVILTASIVAVAGVGIAGYFGRRYFELLTPKEIKKKKYEALAQKITAAVPKSFTEPKTMSLATEMTPKTITFFYDKKPTGYIQMIKNLFANKEINLMNKDVIEFSAPLPISPGASMSFLIYFPKKRMVKVPTIFSSDEDKKVLKTDLEAAGFTVIVSQTGYDITEKTK